jgi:hypothetical protein
MYIANAGTFSWSVVASIVGHSTTFIQTRKLSHIKFVHTAQGEKCAPNCVAHVCFELMK